MCHYHNGVDVTDGVDGIDGIDGIDGTDGVVGQGCSRQPLG